MLTKSDQERQKRIQLLEEYSKVYESKTRSDTITPKDMLLYKEILGELIKLKRIEKCRWDLIEFAKEYLSEERGSDSKHFLLTNDKPTPEFHYQMAQEIMRVKDSPHAEKLAVICPRGHAKSAIMSQINILHSIAYGLTEYTIFISATRPTVIRLLRFIKSVLKDNTKFREDFGELLSPITQRNIQDKEDVITTFNNVTIECFGADSPIRGARSMTSRPDLIFDDLEDPANVASRDSISKMVDKFDKEFMPLGDTKTSKYYYAGTILAYNSLLHQIYTRRGDWKCLFWRAVVKDADRQDLWEQYREIYTDMYNPNRGEDAKKFYEENKEEMLAGAETLWPEMRDYKELMDLKFNNSLAYQTEQQNEPIDRSKQTFRPEEFVYYDNIDDEFIYDHGQQIALKDCVADVSGIDLARGKESGDFVAIARVVRGPSGIMYETHCDAFKAPISEQLERTIKFIVDTKTPIFLVESVAYQGSFSDQLKEELQRRGIYHTKVLEVSRANKGSKESRILELEPMVMNGSLRFNSSHYVLLDQMEKWKPKNNTTHDDCPDVLQMCCSHIAANVDTGILEYYRELAKEKDKEES